MGVSTDAKLYFGFDFHDPDGDLFNEEFSDFGCDWETMYAAKLGLKEPTCEYEENKELFSKYWQDKRDLVEKCPFVVGYHCSDECTVHYVAIKEFKAWRGSPIEISLPEITESQIEEFKKFCKLMDIEYQEPKWYLASYWG